MNMGFREILLYHSLYQELSNCNGNLKSSLIEKIKRRSMGNIPLNWASSEVDTLFHMIEYQSCV